MSGAICGGVVSMSMFMQDPWAYMMAYVMKDRYYKWYIAAKKRGDAKRAKELFCKHAISMT